jgi:hypothetical protein
MRNEKDMPPLPIGVVRAGQRETSERRHDLDALAVAAVEALRKLNAAAEADAQRNDGYAASLAGISRASLRAFDALGARP